MKPALFALALAGLTGLHQPVAAQSVSAHVPGSVLGALRDLGLQAEPGSDANGNPAIQAQLDGLPFSVLFYGCTEGALCQDLQLRARFAAQNITTDQLNQWNRTAYIGKAYLNEDGAITLEHPIAGADGLSRYNVQRILLRWKVALDGFRETLASAQ